ncbi:MAG: PepSY domain-containing protein [Vicinamibacterales bacterium]
MKPVTVFAAACLLVAAPALAAQKIAQAALPKAVQATVIEQTKDATVLNISKEVEKGRTVYEVETKRNGKTRDFVVDGAGTVLAVEEEVDPGSLPAAVKQTLDQQSAGGTLKRVEKVTRGKSVSYEAAVVKSGKTVEIAIGGDGVIQKGD